MSGLFIPEEERGLHQPESVPRRSRTATSRSLAAKTVHELDRDRQDKLHIIPLEVIRYGSTAAADARPNVCSNRGKETYGRMGLTLSFSERMRARPSGAANTTARGCDLRARRDGPSSVRNASLTRTSGRTTPRLLKTTAPRAVSVGASAPKRRTYPQAKPEGSAAGPHSEGGHAAQH